MQMESFDKLYVDQLRDVYNAEKQLIKALPKMAKAATNKELKSAFEEHLEVTKRQVERLEEVFRGLGRPATGKTCKAMAGLIDLIRHHQFASSDRILFLHLGGTPALHAYADLFAPRPSTAQ